MMKLVSALVLFASAAPSWADIPSAPRRQPTRISTSEDLVFLAAQNLEASIKDFLNAQTPSRDPLFVSLQALANSAQRLRLQTTQSTPLPVSLLEGTLEKIDQAFMAATVVVHSRPNLLSNSSRRNLWYAIPKAIGAAKFALNSGRGITVTGPTAFSAYSFQGTIENTPFFAEGSSPAEFMTNCQDSLEKMRLSMMDELVLSDGRQAKTSGYWNAASACGVMLLNAAPTFGGESVQGSFENVPFTLPYSYDEAQIRELLLVAIPDGSSLAQSVDSAVIGGIASRTSGYWNARQIRSLILNNLPARSNATIIKAGKIESVSFLFSGDTRSEIQSRCKTFFTEMQFQMADEITVNQTQYRTSGYYNAESACMAITAAN